MSIRKANESEPIEDASLQTLDVAETRGDELFWDKSVGSLMTGQTVTGVERASRIQAFTWNCRNQCCDGKGEAQAVQNCEARVPMRSTGAD